MFHKRQSLLLVLVALAFLLIGCAGGPVQTKQATPVPPTPSPVQGQQLLNKTAHLLTTAKTLHGVIDLTLKGQTLNGTVSNEVWNEAPARSRTVVLKSSVSQVAVGATSVNDGKQVWQYDPQKQVVYTGPAPAGGTANTRGQNRLLLDLVLNVFTHSAGSYRSSASVNGHDTYDVHVVSQSSTSTTGQDDYEGEVYIDKASALPVRLDLSLQRIGQVQLDFANLALNQPLPAQTFVFSVPAGVKVLPLQAANPGTGALTLEQAQQQAGYHLLSVPGNQAGYTLREVTALGAPGSQIYTLSYQQGSMSFTLAEGKPLASLPAMGQQVSLRGTTGALSSQNGVTTLAWTEKGIGIRISGQLSNDQVLAIANLLT